MEARERKPAFSRAQRYAAGWLILLVLLGLWQGFGRWLIGGQHGA